MSNWINAEEKLPKKYVSVLFAFKGKISRVKGKVCEGWYNGEYWDCFASLDGLNEKFKVTHWQPLPEKP